MRFLGLPSYAELRAQALEVRILRAYAAVRDFDTPAGVFGLSLALGAAAAMQRTSMMTIEECVDLALDWTLVGMRTRAEIADHLARPAIAEAIDDESKRRERARRGLT